MPSASIWLIRNPDNLGLVGKQYEKLVMLDHYLVMLVNNWHATLDFLHQLTVWYLADLQEIGVQQHICTLPYMHVDYLSKSFWKQELHVVICPAYVQYKGFFQTQPYFRYDISTNRQLPCWPLKREACWLKSLINEDSPLKYDWSISVGLHITSWAPRRVVVFRRMWLSLLSHGDCR